MGCTPMQEYVTYMHVDLIDKQMWAKTEAPGEKTAGFSIDRTGLSH